MNWVSNEIKRKKAKKNTARDVLKTLIMSSSETHVGFPQNINKIDVKHEIKINIISKSNKVKQTKLFLNL